MGNGGRLNFVLFVCFVTVYEVNSLTWTAMKGGGWVCHFLFCLFFVCCFTLGALENGINNTFLVKRYVFMCASPIPSTLAYPARDTLIYGYIYICNSKSRFFRSGIVRSLCWLVPFFFFIIK